jgi:hypothetical protein
VDPFLWRDKVRGKSALTYPVLEADVLAKAVFASLAVITFLTYDHRFDCNLVARLHSPYVRAHFFYFASYFVSSRDGQWGSWMCPFVNM